MYSQNKGAPFFEDGFQAREALDVPVGRPLLVAVAEVRQAAAGAGPLAVVASRGFQQRLGTSHRVVCAGGGRYSTARAEDVAA